MTDRPYAHMSLDQLQGIIDDPRIGMPAKRRAEDEKRHKMNEVRHSYEAAENGNGAGAIEIARKTMDDMYRAEPAPARVKATRFCLPLPPNRTNKASGKGHWTHDYRADEAFRAVADALLQAGYITAPPPVPYQRVRVRATLYVWGEMDDDNAMARCKPALDWLVKRGYVVDDRRENVEWAGIPDQEIDRGCPRLVLRITNPRSKP